MNIDELQDDETSLERMRQFHSLFTTMAPLLYRACSHDLPPDYPHLNRIPGLLVSTFSEASLGPNYWGTPKYLRMNQFITAPKPSHQELAFLNTTRAALNDASVPLHWKGTVRFTWYENHCRIVLQNLPYITNDTPSLSLIIRAAVAWTECLIEYTTRVNREYTRFHIVIRNIPLLPRDLANLILTYLCPVPFPSCYAR